ncbi:MAG: hypothetical protein K2Q01_11785 [Rickettsiales bacterium]|nr:hypothetical protein [Rickettsiales bacterium]
MIKKQDKELLMLWLCYSLSYLLWRRLGVPFEMALPGHMHFLDFNLMQNDLLRSLFYLHSQPPIFMGLLGIALKIAGKNAAIVLEGIMWLSGLATIYALLAVLRRLGIHRRVMFTILAWLLIPPTFSAYEAWAYAMPLEIAATAFLCLGLLGHFQSASRRHQHMLAASLCVLGLVHARWHLAVILGVSALALSLTPAPKRRALALIMLLWLSPLIGWIAKNQILFEVPGVSSWLGANLNQVSITLVSPPELAALKAEKRISEHFPVGYNRTAIAKALPETCILPPIHPSLAFTKHGHFLNLNYQGVILTSKQDAKDSLTLIKMKPGNFALQTWQRIWRTSWKPAMSYPNLTGFGRLYKIAGMKNVRFVSFNALPKECRVALEYGAFILYTAIPLLCLLLTLRQRYTPEARFIYCTSFIIWSLLAISCIVNGWEQERMRYGSITIYTAYMALLAQWLITGIHNKNLAIIGLSERIRTHRARAR